MAVTVKTGVFSTGTGAVSSTIDVTGLGFNPTAGTFLMFLFWNGRTETTDAVGGANIYTGIGVLDGNNVRASTIYSEDATASAVGGAYFTDGDCIAVIDSAGVLGLLDFDSVITDGVRLIVTDQMPFSMRVMYWVVGGLDNTAIGTQTLPASTTGNQSVTGLSFQPDFGLYICNTSNLVNSHSNTRAVMGFGAALNSSSQAVWSAGTDPGSPNADTGAYTYNGECIACMDEANLNQVEYRAAFVSYNGDGYTVNVLEIPNVNRAVFYVLAKGGSWSINDITTRTDTVTDIVISGLGFAPQGGIVVSSCQALSTQDSGTGHGQISAGVFDSTTSRRALGAMDEDGVATMETATAIEHDEVYVNIDINDAVQGLMDVKSMNSDGVTFIMDDADPASNYCFVVTAGSVAPTGSLLQRGVKHLTGGMAEMTGNTI